MCLCGIQIRIRARKNEGSTSMRHDIVSASLRNNRRRIVTLFVALASVVAFAGPACSSNDVAAGRAAEQACHQNSDCASGLLCALGACRAMCSASSDCQTGGSCIDNGDVAVCQYADEKNKPCNKQSDCPSPLACASDYRCRNLCMSDGDCNVLGIKGPPLCQRRERSAVLRRSPGGQ